MDEAEGQLSQFEVQATRLAIYVTLQRKWPTLYLHSGHWDSSHCGSRGVSKDKESLPGG